MNGTKMAATPEPNQNPLWTFFTTLLPWATVYGLMHTAIYYIFKYFSDSRDAKLNKIVDEKLEAKIEPKIKRLEDKIDDILKLHQKR